MPDQSSASTEHAIMQQITEPLAELPDDPVASVASERFPVVLRGYDRVAVDAYVNRTAQLVAELYAGRSPEGAVRRALERVGEQVSEILRRAHDTAEELTAQSRVEAEERLMRARQEGDEIIRDAEARAREIEAAAAVRARDLDAEVDHIWAERDRIVSDVRRLAEELDALAAAASTRFPPAEPAVEPAEAQDVVDKRAVEGRGEEPIVQPAVDEPLLAPHGAEPRLAADDEPTAVAAPTVAFTPVIPRVIDLMHLKRERVIGCWQVGEVLVDPGPESCLQKLLDALSDERPRALLLTHIHLDHAGATGALVQRWPDLEVYVHERGAPHLIDPERLLDSARRLYGEDMERLWGEVLAVPEQNIRVLRGGERVLDDRFEVAYTPGHASHHLCYLYDDGTAFVGDVAGVRITPGTLPIPPTPPPDIDIEAWHASIELVRSWNSARLAMTHFGASEDVRDHLAEVGERLDTWAALARTEDQDTFIATITEEIERDAGADLLPAYTQAAPPEQLYAGLERYWRTRATHASERPPAPASTHAGRSTGDRP
jgi:glyoxylase-like metal-dependent hydrolase (beta-lactamase superfamily II)